MTDLHDGLFRASGQTFWACQSDLGEAGMAWDWVELGEGVVAMADPLAVVTNLRLVGADGDALDRYEALCHLNTLVHGLPWQQEVGRVLDVLASEQEPSQRITQRPGAWQRPAALEAAPHVRQHPLTGHEVGARRPAGPH